MNHKQIEEWLFTYLEGDDLEIDQMDQLQDHLIDCEDCQNLVKSWREVDRYLLNADLASPSAGFTQRWQVRFERDHQLLQQRQTLAALIFALGSAFILLASLVILLLPWFGMPEVFVWGWIYRMSELMAYFESANHLVSLLMRAFSGEISPLWWILIAGLLSELAVLWLVSYRWLTNPRRAMIDEASE